MKELNQGSSWNLRTQGTEGKSPELPEGKKKSKERTRNQNRTRLNSNAGLLETMEQCFPCFEGK